MNVKGYLHPIAARSGFSFYRENNSNQTEHVIEFEVMFAYSTKKKYIGKH